MPKGVTQLSDLIKHKNILFALGNIFKACYRLLRITPLAVCMM